MFTYSISRAIEKGYVDAKGTVDSFSVEVFNGNTSTLYTAPNPVTPTIETQSVTFWIPADPATSPNHTPVITPIGDRSVYEGLPLGFTVQASDPDPMQTPTYAVSGLPAGASFNAGSHAFAWTPSPGQAGVYNVRLAGHA